MNNNPPIIRKYSHVQNSNAFLFIGYDKTGRLISRIEKNGSVIARDIFVRLPAPTELDELGWTLSQ